KKITTGFHHTAILGLKDLIIAAVKSGKIRRFFLIGGCDGAKPGRNYYTRLAELVPKDCVILTLACGKYRFNGASSGLKPGVPDHLPLGGGIPTSDTGFSDRSECRDKMDFGQIEGIPRLIDVGQCNNAYSAIQVALALANAFDCGVNELPLTLVLSWFEQKAVAILLTLLYLNIKGIYIGPTAPAFLSKNVLSILAEKYDLKLIGDPEVDLKKILGG
ncbi:MAG: hypothetical protein Q8O22_02890, partial [Candidatus Omnitrophota bacterium]|nr:hypothetical protein [Candidatus Omnitrophota bacterium]